MTEKNRKAKSSGPRTEVFAMRLDPKLKYLAEIAARKQRRSLANFIEWSLEQSLKEVLLLESVDFNGEYNKSVFDEANKLWDLEPSDRFIKLAENYPDLLNYEEQLIWKAIFEVYVYDSYTDSEGNAKIRHLDFVYGTEGEKKAERYTINECWPQLVSYANGTSTVEDLKEALRVNGIPF